MERALGLYIAGRSDSEIAELIGAHRKTVAAWKRRADWQEKAAAALRVDEAWYAEQRRKAALRATREAYAMLDDGGLEPGERIELTKLLGKWGAMEIKRVEQKTEVSLDGMSDEELRALIEGATGGGRGR